MVFRAPAVAAAVGPLWVMLGRVTMAVWLGWAPGYGGAALELVVIQRLVDRLGAGGGALGRAAQDRLQHRTTGSLIIGTPREPDLVVPAVVLWYMQLVALHFFALYHQNRQNGQRTLISR